MLFWSEQFGYEWFVYSRLIVFLTDARVNKEHYTVYTRGTASGICY